MMFKEGKRYKIKYNYGDHAQAYYTRNIEVIGINVGPISKYTSVVFITNMLKFKCLETGNILNVKVKHILTCRSLTPEEEFMLL